MRERLARIGGGLLAAALFVRGARGRPRPDDVEPDPREYETGPKRRAEGVAIAFMLLASLCGMAFPVLYILADNNQTQWLGLSIGLALMFTSAGAIVAGKAVVPRETHVEERHELAHPDEQGGFDEGLRSVGEGVTRRGLLTAATGAAGFGIATAAAVPAASLGPKVGQIVYDTPWRRGRYLVDERDQRLKADEIAIGELVTAFPEGADKEDLGSPVVLVRLEAREFHMTPEQMKGVVDGIVAYSKICTHAACAVSMFRYPVSQPTTPSKPALVCPCHYSTFNPAKAAKVEFGPAGRPLPQLPMMLDRDGLLVAAGEFRGTTGPAWWAVRQ